MSQSTVPKYLYRRRLPHLQKAECDLFVTFCTCGRKQLSPEARDLVLAHVLREGGIQASLEKTPPRIRLHAAVVMPDHVHLLLSPLRDAEGWPYPLVQIMQCVKGATAHAINKLLCTSGPVWEEESFDHVLRSYESLKQKCEYIRSNPVRAGLVANPKEYRWWWTAEK